MRKKEPKGAKLNKDKKIEGIVIKWIMLEPSITNKQISDKLLEKHGYKISPQSIGSWRENYYKEAKAELKQKLETQDVEVFEFTNEDRINNYKSFLEYKTDLEKIYKLLVKKINKDAISKDGEVTIFYSKDDYGMLKDYILVLTNLTEKIGKLMGNIDLYGICSEVIGKSIEFVSICFPMEGNEINYEELKKSFKEYDKYLKEKYLLVKTNG